MIKDEKRNVSKQLSFLVTPSLQSSAIYTVTMVSTFASVWLLIWMVMASYKIFLISKIPNPKCVSGYSEQLWFLEPRPPPPPKPNFHLFISHLTLHYLSYHYISFTLFISINWSLHVPTKSKVTVKINHRIRWGVTQWWWWAFLFQITFAWWMLVYWNYPFDLVMGKTQ